ncbi:3-oxo-tetronate kinase [Aestuariivirga sp.]|uniref:3-oxo-tetronate kinase n=1 Tax=Aestuariivirga sp. TaxID=2650926 RepID=UPI0039E40523
MILGCIADDFTGATDLANTLTIQGMRTVQVIGVPDGAAPEADAIVVALKSRTIPAAEAVSQSLSACRWLKRNGARQILFKYCSTFDSTDQGNIGPVADALLDELGSSFTIACPAFPENKRSIYMGHLFVGRDLLSESSMRNHPLTPMTDLNLVRVLGRQTSRTVGLVAHDAVRQGAARIMQEFESLKGQGISHAIVDAVADQDLLAIGEACSGMALITGGSGIALGLPANFRKAGILPAQARPASLPKLCGRAVIVSGSCSTATQGQVENFIRAGGKAFEIDASKAVQMPGAALTDAMAFAQAHEGDNAILIYSTADAAKVKAVQAEFGREHAGEMIERTMADIAKSLASSGIRRFVVAGGETSGAVVQALGVKQLEIGPQIVPGVPATISIGSERFALVLKSGNFGGPSFFTEALQVLS